MLTRGIKSGYFLLIFDDNTVTSKQNKMINNIIEWLLEKMYILCYHNASK